VNTREGNTGKPSTKLINEAHMRPVIVGSNNSIRPKTMSSSTFIKTFKVLPLVKWGKSDGFQAPVPDLLAIVDQGFPNNFLSFRVMSPILVENDVIPLDLNCPENNSPKQRTDFMHLLEPSKGLKIRKTQPSTPSKPNKAKPRVQESYHYIGSGEMGLLPDQSDVGEIKSFERINFC
jgi:hypothetical protein